MTRRLLIVKKKYEETWERSFQFSLMQGQPWLKYTDGLMFCTACKEDGVMEKNHVFYCCLEISIQLLSNTIKKKFFLFRLVQYGSDK